MIDRTSQGIRTFLTKTKDFLDNFQKSKTELALDITGIESCSVLLDRVEQAQADYENASQVAKEENLLFESQLAKALNTFHVNYSYLKVGLNQSLEKQPLLLTKEEPSIADWLKSTTQFYQRVLADPELFIIVNDFSLTREDITAGQEEVNLTLSTYEVLVNNRDGIAIAMKKRDEAFSKLINQVVTLQSQIFKKTKDPKNLKKMNLPVIHDEVGQLIGMVKDSSIT